MLLPPHHQLILVIQLDRTTQSADFHSQNEPSYSHLASSPQEYPRGFSTMSVHDHLLRQFATLNPLCLAELCFKLNDLLNYFLR